MADDANWKRRWSLGTQNSYHASKMCTYMFWTQASPWLIIERWCGSRVAAVLNGSEKGILGLAGVIIIILTFVRFFWGRRHFGPPISYPLRTQDIRNNFSLPHPQKNQVHQNCLLGNFFGENNTSAYNASSQPQGSDRRTEFFHEALFFVGTLRQVASICTWHLSIKITAIESVCHIGLVGSLVFQGLGPFF